MIKIVGEGREEDRQDYLRGQILEQHGVLKRNGSLTVYSTRTITDVIWDLSSFVYGELHPNRRGRSLASLDPKPIRGL